MPPEQLFPSQSLDLILASQSSIRTTLLQNAGLRFTAKPANIDEDAVRQTLTVDGTSDPGDVAEVLARAKAEHISNEHPESLVIGADQILSMKDKIFTKPENDSQALKRLLTLQGKTHELHASVALAENGETIWAHTDIARLTMRPLEPERIGQYLAAAGKDVLQSVGAYKLEGLGIHLFSEIKGDYFTILGLPMLPLLGELRKKGVIAQ